MTVSVVVESWNIDGDAAGLARLLGVLAPQLGDAQLVITHAGLSRQRRAALGRATWVELPSRAGYYEHKNAGFDASTGDVVAFIDGDCEPSAGWLAALLAPFREGALVVAGATSYAGPLAGLANELDFPYFSERRWFEAMATSPTRTVRNFFANNVAFERAVFAARRYPTIAPMFHGQCQVLALCLGDAGIPIAYAPSARVTHAWPGSITEWLQVRLLRGADTTQLLPHVIRRYAPRAQPVVARLGAVPAFAVLGLRAIAGTWSALRRGPALRGLALVAGVSAVDALGAAAAPAVYRWIG